MTDKGHLQRRRLLSSSSRLPGIQYVDSSALYNAEGVQLESAYTLDDILQDGVKQLSSWGNPYKYLQNAINNSIEGDKIFVKYGTYCPTHLDGQTTNGINNINIVNHKGSLIEDRRTAALTLKKDVSLYGGFTGIEYDELARQIDAEGFMIYETLLSGNITELPYVELIDDTIIYGSKLTATAQNLCSIRILNIADNSIVDGFDMGYVSSNVNVRQRNQINLAQASKLINSKIYNISQILYTSRNCAAIGGLGSINNINVTNCSIISGGNSLNAVAWLLPSANATNSSVNYCLNAGSRACAGFNGGINCIANNCKTTALYGIAGFINGINCIAKYCINTRSSFNEHIAFNNSSNCIAYGCSTVSNTNGWLGAGNTNCIFINNNGGIAYEYGLVINEQNNIYINLLLPVNSALLKYYVNTNVNKTNFINNYIINARTTTGLIPITGGIGQAYKTAGNFIINNFVESAITVTPYADEPVVIEGNKTDTVLSDLKITIPSFNGLPTTNVSNGSHSGLYPNGTTIVWDEAKIQELETYIQKILLNGTDNPLRPLQNSLLYNSGINTEDYPAPTEDFYTNPRPTIPEMVTVGAIQ